MKTKNFASGLILVFLTIGLISCGSQPTKRLSPPAPELIETQVIKYRNLPLECTAAVEAEVVTKGQTNEDLARAYKDNLEELVTVDATHRKCRDLSQAEPASDDF